MPINKITKSRSLSKDLSENNKLSVATLGNNLLSKEKNLTIKATSSNPKLRRVDHVKISDINELMIKYEIGNEVGKGSFGVVVKVTDKFTEKPWAMKIIEKDKKRNRGIKSLEREIQILKLVSHPHIIYLQKVYECTNKIFLIMELCNGDLSTEMKNRKMFQESDARRLAEDLLSAVAYLHRNDIVHRDLKLDNILLATNPRDLTDDLYIKLTDFGLSVIKGGRGLDSMLRDFCGTLLYMSPELIAAKTYSHQCDVWALGVIIFALLSGSFPFMDENKTILAESICNKEVIMPDSFSKPAKDLLTKMLLKDPAVRITASEAQQHPWIKGRTMSMDINPGNVIELMKQWKDEMKKPQTRIDDSSLYDIPKNVKPPNKQ